jgi:hypothetical protein
MQLVEPELRSYKHFMASRIFNMQTTHPFLVSMLRSLSSTDATEVYAMSFLQSFLITLTLQISLHDTLQVKLTTLFVPGAWRTTASYSAVANFLEAAGYTTKMIQLESVGGPPHLLLRLTYSLNYVCRPLVCWEVSTCPRADIKVPNIPSRQR